MTLIDDSVVLDTHLVKQGVLPNPFVEVSQSDNKEADQAGVLDCSAYSVIPGCTVAFLDSQINGAVWMV
jgi:hypothetical protein